MSQNETKIQKQVQSYLKSIGAYCFKVHGSIYMRAGIPDINCCYKGLYIAIETKDYGNTASELQLAHIRQITKAGGIAFVAYSVEDVKKEFERRNLL